MIRQWILLGAYLLGPLVLQAQEVSQPLTLTLEEALEIALDQNYTLRDSRLNLAKSEWQIKEAYGQVMPRVDVSASYQRNLKTANPFAGSRAGSLFGSLGYLDWLAYNERARTDGNPNTEPISLDEFRRRQQAGMEAAGVAVGGSDNPFAVDNQFRNAVSITQTLYSGTAMAAIKGAKKLRMMNEAATRAQEHALMHQVRTTFYQALLAQEQLRIASLSVERTQRTVEETRKRLIQGVASKYDRLSAEVELANLESNLIQAQNQAQLALNNLKLLLGIPVEQPVRLRGKLTPPEGDGWLFTRVSVQELVQEAIKRRPDLQQAYHAIEVQRAQIGLTRAGFFPTLSAFADLSYIGNVPDNREVVFSDPNDPFTFRKQKNAFFSDAYWQPNIAIGVRLNWNLFSGFQTRARMQQDVIELQRTQLRYQQLIESVKVEVDQALRNLQSAYQRILSQERNVERAELNYTFAVKRLKEGMAMPLEERQASQLLDQSRLNYYQAIYDYLVARSNFERVTGLSLNEETFRLTHVKNTSMQENGAVR